MFRSWQETTEGPAQKFDALIFALKTQFEQSELEREGQFTFTRDVLRKLTYALECKIESDLNGVE
jgi:hypothetical protein